jgi:DNA-binding transcriptional MerR regulator
MATTIGRLARSVGLSRSTLLYYDRMGLLSPSGRSPAGYRLYERADRRRLERIIQYRQAGIPVKEIRRLLTDRPGRTAQVLSRRLKALQSEIRSLRHQQKMIVRLLNLEKLPEQIRGVDKRQWVALLRAAGLDDAAMWRWHAEFERLSPEGHQDFLEALGMLETEAAAIREHVRSDGGGGDR